MSNRQFGNNHYYQNRQHPQQQQVQYGGFQNPQHQHVVENPYPQQQQFMQQPPLPPGWVEATDPNTGKIYYCNPKTRETKWERPVAMTPAIVPSQHGPPPQEREPLPPGWVEAKDPTSGKTYYCNPQTRETRWERPVHPSTATSISANAFVPNHQAEIIPASTVPQKVIHHGSSSDQPKQLLNSNPMKTTPTTTGVEAKHDQTFDELSALTTGQIAEMVKFQERQRKEKETELEDEERQVDLSTIVNAVDKNEPTTNEQHKYIPVDLSTLSKVLLQTDRTEQGRLDVRMYALREELQKFGYHPSSSQTFL